MGQRSTREDSHGMDRSGGRHDRNMLCRKPDDTAS